MELPKSTKKYYQEKSTKIVQFIFDEVSGKNYEGFMNIPASSKMLRLKYDVDLNLYNYKKNKITLSEDKIFKAISDEILSNLLYSSLIRSDIVSTTEEVVSLMFQESSSKEILNKIHEFINIKEQNRYIRDLNKIRFMYIGSNHYPFIFNIIGVGKEDVYLGEYKGIKIYLVEGLDDIFFSNAPVIDLKTIDIRYNEYIKEEHFNKYEKELYENIDNEYKKSVVTANCVLGDVNVYKLKTTFNDKQYMRKIKLQRLLKY
jgi:hypothetical protein